MLNADGLLPKAQITFTEVIYFSKSIRIVVNPRLNDELRE
jgi:hypothetical protein